ncbi:EF-hand calcium-binding domain-containing protein 9-like [Leucoraja erinacea]|uniref:EF-hand calcium-binding domain-containing protein 9-like n=1 Tax=Leucoraja erinaceus TaxID=7782 RepID=UPI00245453C8|nr:EF-hand calcium-binding domain-containing protein 9-like [Leucoraja erinacea]
MQLKLGFIFNFLYLDKIHVLMSVRNTVLLLEYFKLLDVHDNRTLNDVQFFHFLRCITDMTTQHIKKTFNMFDWRASGEIGFDEFYMLICIIIANKDKMEQQFLYRHSRPIFDLFDMDGGHTISPAEFYSAGFLFNIKGRAFLQMFQDYSGTSGENLTYNEFKLFIMACVDKQEKINEGRRKKKQSRSALFPGKNSSFTI